MSFRKTVALVVGVTACAGVSGCCRKHLPRVEGTAASPHRAASQLTFQSVAGKLGLDFRPVSRLSYPLTNLDSFGHGCAFFDFDNDGWPDILLVGEPRCALFHNVPDGHGGRRFQDISAESGVASVRGPWKGCAVGDVDNDGYLDVVLTGYHRCALLRNSRGVRLQDVTARSGIRQSGWASSAAFGDYDGDGLLDLYIGNYVVFGPDSPQHCRFSNGAMGGCPPQVYAPERGVLLHNNGDGTFADVTRAAGLDHSSGKTLAVSWCDFDDDGDQDLYLANDGVPGNLFRNDGDGHFTDIGVESGTAFGVNHLAQAGMGVDWADYNRDGFLDLVVTAFSNESFSLYRYDGMLFDNVSAEAGLASPTYYPLGFGCHFLDVDLDGWPDLAFADGHVYDQAAKIHRESPFRQRPQLLRNDGGRFTDVSSQAGSGFQQAVVGRGLAVGDFDNDGRPDLLMATLDGPPLLLRNVTQPAGAAIRLRLRADGRHGNLFAYGARVSVDSPGGRRAASVSPGASYLSSSDPRVYMGALPGELPTGVIVHWPDGRRESFPPPVPDRETELREGHGGGAANAAVQRSGE